jgi:hypothetical protein
MNDHPYTLHLRRHPRNRAIPENVQFHVSIDGYPVRVYVVTRSLSLLYITVCTDVHFIEVFAEIERRKSSVLGEGKESSFT